MENKIKMGWGDPHFLLEILDGLYVGANSVRLHNLSYGDYEGIPFLIEQTKAVIEKTTGNTYKHILITHGATNGINAILRKFKNDGGKIVYTTKYGYPSYKGMILKAGLIRANDLLRAPALSDNFSSMSLIDSPENPYGNQFSGGNPTSDIWDSVYHSKIYTKDVTTKPKHKYMVGSYSKLLGVAGARVGFIATNDDLAYQSLYMESKLELTGPSIPSQLLIIDILKSIDLDEFMDLGKEYLNSNKTDFQKIEYLFDGQEINPVGMFYCIQADPKAVKILENANIEYVRLDEQTIRLSMGQTKDVINQAIKAILKEDGK